MRLVELRHRLTREAVERLIFTLRDTQNLVGQGPEPPTVADPALGEVGPGDAQ